MTHPSGARSLIVELLRFVITDHYTAAVEPVLRPGSGVHPISAEWSIAASTGNLHKSTLSCVTSQTLAKVQT
jgi:hypothetical protein